MKSRNVKGSNLPTINLSKEIIAVLSRLDADEVKEIIVGIRDYIYKDKEPNVNEEIKDIMDMTLDNINYIARGYLNGKKGGRPKKSAPQEVTTTEFDNPKTEDDIENANAVDLSHSEASDDNLYHQEVEKPVEAKKTAKKEVTINNNTEKNMGTLTNIIQKQDGTFEKIDLPKENEMLETLLSDEEIIEKVVNEFMETEGNSGYSMFIELNNTDPKSDEFRVLWNKWCHKWNRYLTNDERRRLMGDITDRVCKIYFNRYKEIA